MLTKLRSMAFIVGLCISIEGVSVADKLLEFARTKEEIASWAASHLGSPAVQELKANGRAVIVVTGDSGSGLKLMSCYVFVYEAGQWNLLLARFTNSARLEVALDKRAGALVVWSAAHRELLRIPTAALTLGFDASEQSE